MIKLQYKLMRNFSNYPIKLVTLHIIHENCWSRYYLNDDLVKILDLIPYMEKNLLRVFAITSEKGYKTIEKLKFDGKIKEIFNVYRNGNGIFVDLARDFDSSVLSIINKNNGIVLNTAKYEGMEIWNILIYEHKINRMLKELDEIAQIEKIKISDHIPLTNTLSDNELKILSIAYENGYFDYPRKIKSGELANLLGISQSTLIYYLRNAERKIIGQFLRKSRMEQTDE